MYNNLQSELKSCATTLPNSGIIETNLIHTYHYDAYAGGFVGKSEGDLSFNDSFSTGYVTGGTTAGGFVGTANCNIDIYASSNQGSVGCADLNDKYAQNGSGREDFQKDGKTSHNLGFAVSAGGYVGLLKSYHSLNIESSITSGVIASRQFAGGMVGLA